jgi:hypothetical protein
MTFKDPRLADRSAERLSVVHAAVHDLEAESVMSALRWLVVGPSVRRDLRATVRACPVLGGPCERSTDPAPPVVWLHVPPFDEAHRLAPVAAVRVGTQPDLLFLVLGGRALGPERVKLASQGHDVGRHSKPH